MKYIANRHGGNGQADSTVGAPEAGERRSGSGDIEANNNLGVYQDLNVSILCLIHGCHNAVKEGLKRLFPKDEKRPRGDWVPFHICLEKLQRVVRHMVGTLAGRHFRLRQANVGGAKKKLR